eukprot:2995377-Rhodomonas_salina.1
MFGTDSCGEIKDKTPSFQHTLYQECGRISLISPCRLCSHYAVSGTDLALPPLSCYAMSGTALGHAPAMRCLVLDPIALRRCYAVSGTEQAHGAMRCPVLTWRTKLCDARY